MTISLNNVEKVGNSKSNSKVDRNLQLFNTDNPLDNKIFKTVSNFQDFQKKKRVLSPKTQHRGAATKRRENKFTTDSLTYKGGRQKDFMRKPKLSTKKSISDNDFSSPKNQKRTSKKSATLTERSSKPSITQT